MCCCEFIIPSIRNADLGSFKVKPPSKPQIRLILPILIKSVTSQIKIQGSFEPRLPTPKLAIT